MSNKYSIFPLTEPKLWGLYLKHVSTLWYPHDVNLAHDIAHWEKLTDNERYFIEHVLAFFAQTDGIVNENLVVNFYEKVDLAEAKSFYAIQMAIETVHSHQYAILIDKYITDPNKKSKLFNAMENISCIKKKAEWSLKWIHMNDKQLPDKVKLCLENSGDDPEINQFLESYDSKNMYNIKKSLLAFICIEGIFFSGSFCAIFWLRSRGIMPGLSTANDYISKDEKLHTDFGIELYKTLFKGGDRLSTETVHELFTEAVDIEKEFITDALPVSLLGMNCAAMSEYIEFVADRILMDLEYPILFGAKCPFNWMESMTLWSKVNFFDKDNAEYQKAGVFTGDPDNIDFNEDF
jgi:ribonucleoside-diphosphate reductase beta chain